MAVTKKFTDTPLQVVAEPGMRARIEKVADDEGISMAQVIREILDDGISKRERLSQKKIGALT